MTTAWKRETDTSEIGRYPVSFFVLKSDFSWESYKQVWNVHYSRNKTCDKIYDIIYDRICYVLYDKIHDKIYDILSYIRCLS